MTRDGADQWAVSLVLTSIAITSCHPLSSQVPAAADLARAADLSVLVLGTDLHVAMENHDAVNITFSRGQLALVQAVAQASPRPVVVVTLTAVPLDLTPLLQNPKVGAILHAGQPSIQTHGVADVLVGKRSPAARVVQTIYPESYQHQVQRLIGDSLHVTHA